MLVYHVPSQVLSWDIMYYTGILDGISCTIPGHVLVYSGLNSGMVLDSGYF